MALAAELATRLILTLYLAGDLSERDDLLAEGVDATFPFKPNGPAHGRLWYGRAIEVIAEALPVVGDPVITWQLEGEHHAVLRVRSTRVHTQTLFGIDPDHRPHHFDETHVVRVRDGRVIEHVVAANDAAWFERVGAALTRVMHGAATPDSAPATAPPPPASAT